MDGVSAGASVLAFVAAAVQTSRVIYNVASCIRSGSPDVRNLVSCVHSLERVLEQLSNLLASQTIPETRQHVVLLEQVTQQCALELEEIYEQLCKLVHEASSGAVKKAWRLVKIAIQKDDLRRMARIIQQHVSILTLQVVIMSSQETSQQTQLLFMLTQSISGPDGNRDNYNQSSQNQRNSALRRDTSATLLAIRSKLDRAPSEIAAKFTGTKSLAVDLESQVGLTSQDFDEISETNCDRLTSFLPKDLNSCLLHLSELAHQEGHHAHSAEAEDILEDLDVLIDSLLGQCEQVCPAPRRSKRSRSPDGGSETEEALKMIKNAATMNRRVHVNRKHKCRPFARSHDSNSATRTGTAQYKHSSNIHTDIERRGHTYQLPQGTIFVFAKHIKSVEHTGNNLETNVISSEFSATLEYLPSSSSAYAKIVANVVHSAGLLGSTTLHPSLSVYPIVPTHSKVFEAIRKGKLDELVELLRTGKSSLRDCDPLGRSLLGHACLNDKPDICRFLLEHGADGDAIEKVADWGDDDPTYLPLLLHCGTYDPALECQRLLLAAGADPCESTEDLVPLYELALYNPILMRHISYYARDFINPEERDSAGDTLLLRFMHRYIYNPQALKFLLSLGANLHARTSQGNTCLHLCFRKACRHSAAFRYDDLNLLPCLSTLLKAGADATAVNRAGGSVTSAALLNRREEDDTTPADIGSFLMDAWMIVLRKCGYNLLDIVGHPVFSHTVRFTTDYREEHFQAMHSWEPWMTTHTFDPQSQEWVEII